MLVVDIYYTWFVIFTIASDNAIFGQTGPKVVSFNLDLVASYLPTDVYAYSTHWFTTQ